MSARWKWIFKERFELRRVKEGVREVEAHKLMRNLEVSCDGRTDRYLWRFAPNPDKMHRNLQRRMVNEEPRAKSTDCSVSR